MSRSGTWRHTHRLTPSERLEVLSLLDRTESDLGRESIDEQGRRTVVHGWPSEHWLEGLPTTLERYALVSTDEPPLVEMCGGGFDERLCDTLLQEHSTLHWWLRNVGSEIPSPASVLRRLALLRITLPVNIVSPPQDASLRAFDPVRDAAAWLAQNNAAFADHPEQGAWKLRDLETRLREPWFDPSGFMLLEIEGQIAASCWTKVHELHPDRYGEIYVISVHPHFQGRGLGAVMVTAGLDVLRRKGVSTVKLFVDDSNVVARQLYERLGFRLERQDALVCFRSI